MALSVTACAAPAPILVVDDDPSIRGLIEAGLTSLGYGVRTAISVADARRQLLSRAHSLVLCDYDMPEASGLDLLTYVSKVYPDLPFIMLTGHDEIDLAREAIKSGAIDFLSKPFELRHLARAVEQNWTRMDRDRERAARLTSEVLSGTIRALVAAVDAKDPHTASHSERVSRLTLRLGRAMALPQDRLRILEFAALLHDVGKIGIPEQVLCKPGPLTEEEWELVRQHPARSAEIVGQVEALAEVATIVRHHHERVDGTGYPDGLQRDAIPRFARMIAVADAYEAMTADRAYRRALPPSEARRILRQHLGTWFDPEIGAVFLDLDDLPDR